MRSFLSPLHSVWRRSQSKFFGALSIFILCSLLAPPGAFAANRCADMLRAAVTAPVRAVKAGAHNTGRFYQWTTKEYLPEVWQTRGRRLILKDEEGPAPAGSLSEFCRPVKPVGELTPARRFARKINPMHLGALLVLGRPRTHSFHLFKGSYHLLFNGGYHLFVTEPIARGSRWMWGKRMQLTLPVAITLSWFSPSALAYGINYFGAAHTQQQMASDAFLHRTNYLELLRTDYRYADIAQRYPLPLTADQSQEASREVRERLGLYDLYYNLGYRDRYLTENPTDEDLAALLQFPMLKPLSRYQSEGIPNLPDYRLKPGHTRDPVPRESMIELVRLVDQLMLRYQLIEEYVNHTPLYENLKHAPRYESLAQSLENDEFTQEIMAHLKAGEITAVQAKMALQESACFDTDFKKSAVLGVERIDPQTGHPLDLKAKQQEILLRILPPLIS